MESTMPAPRSMPPAADARPWWRFGMVWFVLSGPALVIVAGFATMAIAFIGADAEVHAPTPMAALSMRIGGQARVAPAATDRPAAPPATGAAAR